MYLISPFFKKRKPECALLNTRSFHNVKELGKIKRGPNISGTDWYFVIGPFVIILRNVWIVNSNFKQISNLKKLDSCNPNVHNVHDNLPTYNTMYVRIHFLRRIKLHNSSITDKAMGYKRRLKNNQTFGNS